MTLTPQQLKQQLKELNISFRSFSHPAVFTSADISLLTESIPGIDTKNLFLRDEKRRRYVLLCVRAETRIDLKQLGRELNLKGITFCSPEELAQLLGLLPGSVCLFGLANDTERRVEGLIDNSLALDGEMQNHPLINTETLVLKVSEMLRFCSHIQHPLSLVAVPKREDAR
jgi:Ala-tRNA(Pro) deacylase